MKQCALQRNITLHVPRANKPRSGPQLPSSFPVCLDHSLHFRHSGIRASLHMMPPQLQMEFYMLLWAKISKNFRTDFWSLNVLLSFDMFNHAIQHYWVKTSQNFSADCCCSGIHPIYSAAHSGHHTTCFRMVLFSAEWLLHFPWKTQQWQFHSVLCIKNMSIWKW